MKSLRAYARKRDFSRTREPAADAKRDGKSHSFVIQKHDASRLHYDLRFAVDGVLKSWAVPKGMPLHKGEKHLAIQVEDHPLAYANFEGSIPKGEYGGGTVMVWDRGKVDFGEKRARAGLRDGHLDFQLRGKKLHGAWTMVRLRGEGDQWLIIKREEDHATLGRREEFSAKSGRTMYAIAKRNSTQRGRAEPGSNGKTKSRVTASTQRANFVAPMLARPTTELPKDGGWKYEVKFDGYRAVAVIDSRGSQLWSRNKNRLTRYSELEDALESVKMQPTVLDGEIVALEPNGRSSFQLLQRFDEGTERPPLRYYVFDVMAAAGVDLRSKTLIERRQILKKIVPTRGEMIRISEQLKGTPSAIVAASRRHGFEGVIAKRADSRYESGKRTGGWLKLRFALEQEFVIGGFTPPGGARSHFGALLLGYYEGNKLRYAGKVGTGFDEAALAKLFRVLMSKKRASSPFSDAVAETAVTWIRPSLVAQIRFSEWTRDNHLRQPVFLGLRRDKSAREVTRET
jgi:bifunctional non-homologous end joining protein LigD